MDLSKAFGRTNRLKMVNVLINAGLPLPLTRIIKRTHENTSLNVREKNRIGNLEKTNTGVFQGSPLSALLFVVYTTAMMADFRAKKTTPENNRRAQPKRQPNHSPGEPAETHIKKKDEKSEHCTSIESLKQKFAEIYLKQKYEPKTIRPKTITIKVDDIQYADDTTLINNLIKQIFTNIEQYKNSSIPYEIIINLQKTAIMATKSNMSKIDIPPELSQIKIEQKSEASWLNCEN